MIITVLSFSDNMLTPVQVNKKLRLLFIIRIFFSSTRHSFSNDKDKTLPTLPSPNFLLTTRNTTILS